MFFEYRKKFKQLALFYRSMCDMKVQIGTFPHAYNNVRSHVILDTRNAPFVMIFLKHGFGDVLRIPIHQGFVFAIEGNATYEEFLNYFQIKNRSKGEYHIGDFAINLSRQIPNRYTITNTSRIAINKYDPIDRDSEGIYPIGIKNWDEINAARRSSGLSDSGHRTAKNLDKTRNLYPEIYKATKDMDISILYGISPNSKTEDFVRGHI